MNFYDINVDPAGPEKWFLGEPRNASGEPIDWWLFTNGVPYIGERPVNVPIEKDGARVQFNMAAFDVPIVTASVLELISKVCGNAVEAFPIDVGTAQDRMFVLNVIETTPLDEDRSRILRWTQADGRPEKVGKYRMVTEMKIDDARINGRHIARVAGWETALVVSEHLRAKMELLPNHGLSFSPV